MNRLVNLLALGKSTGVQPRVVQYCEATAGPFHCPLCPCLKKQSEPPNHVLEKNKPQTFCCSCPCSTPRATPRPCTQQEGVRHLSKMLHISHDSATALCTKLPRLLTLTPKEQQRRLSAAAKLLGVSQSLVKDVAVLQPGILAHPTPVLRYSFFPSSVKLAEAVTPVSTYNLPCTAAVPMCCQKCG